MCSRGLQNGGVLTALLGCLAVVTLLLSAAGLYGVMSRWVGGRTREFAIREALGATPSSVLALIALRVARMVGVGAFVGVSLAFVVVRLTVAYLYGIDGTEWVSFVTACATLILVSVLAAVVPAWHVWKLDPARSLRC